MKVLFDCDLPFFLAHGGQQVQIEQTAAALRSIGVEVEMARWWDAQQTGDVLHLFERPSPGYVQMAQERGFRVVMAELLTGTGSRSRRQLFVQRAITAVTRRTFPAAFVGRMHWDSYRLADACVALTPWEAHLMRYLFGAPAERVHVVPNGVEEVFLSPAPERTRGLWLVCTATITPRKRVLELARAAIEARTPTWIIGRPYSEGDAYAIEFTRVAQQHPEWVRYEGAISDRSRLAEIYGEARGFVLLSTMESLSLSALEAAACSCPLLLSDLPWATCTFGSSASYCPVGGTAPTATALRRFYDAAPEMPAPPKPLTWREVAVQLRTLYERVCSSSR
jgi:glycosyltransferase involved in cell wall biosynthesis